jgi:hypothetical protein
MRRGISRQQIRLWRSCFYHRSAKTPSTEAAWPFGRTPTLARNGVRGSLSGLGTISRLGTSLYEWPVTRSESAGRLNNAGGVRPLWQRYDYTSRCITSVLPTNWTEQGKRYAVTVDVSRTHADRVARCSRPAPPSEPQSRPLY